MTHRASSGAGMTVLSCVLLLGVALAAVALRPTERDRFAPIRSEGQPSVSGRFLRAELRKVVVARSVQNAAGGRADTSGVFVLVDLRLEALREPVLVSDGIFVLRDGDGRAYDASSRDALTMGASAELTAGLPTNVPARFEVPVDVRPPLEVQVLPGVSPFPGDLLVIPIGWSGEALRRQIAGADEDVELEEAGIAS